MTEDSRDELESSRETLEYIRLFLDKSRHAFSDNGFYYLYWGIVIPLTTGLSYLLGYLKLFKWIGIAWLIIYILSFVFFTIMERRREKRVKTFASRIYNSVWGGLFFTVVSIFLLLLIRGTLNIVLSLSLLAGLLGMAYWVGGYILENKTIKFLAAGWWLCCIGFGFTPEKLTPAFMAGATILLEFIPGLILYRKSKQNNHG